MCDVNPIKMAFPKYWIFLIVQALMAYVYIVFVTHAGNKVKTLQDIQRQSIVQSHETDLQRYILHVRSHTKQILCDNIFANKTQDIIRAQTYLHEHRHHFNPFPVELFPMVTKNCDKFLNKMEYSESHSSENVTFPIAFSILTHGNIEELERLIRILYNKKNIYCIHVDRKASDIFKKAVNSLINCLPNVFIASKLENITYEHFSRLRAEINCVGDLLHRHKTWTYLINLAASEIPLKSNGELVDALKKLNNTNDVREVYRNRKTERYTFKHVVNNEGKVLRTTIPLSPPPGNLTVVKGLAYGAFTRAFLEFTLTNQIARTFLLWTKDTHSPDEHYWATLNNLYHNAFLKSPGGYHGHPDTSRYVSRYIVWKSNMQQQCHGIYRHNICVFGVGDLAHLKKSNQLIANKFDLTLDPIAYTCMEEMLRKKTRM